MPAKKILVIDDELFARRVLESALTRMGHEVVLAASAAEGLALLQEAPVDAITCDLMMPVETGLDFLRKLKSLPALREIPVIIITAAGLKDGLDQARALGALASVSKPFSESQLKRAIEAALAHHASPFV